MPDNYRENQAKALQYAAYLERTEQRPRRNAVDYGVPQIHYDIPQTVYDPVRNVPPIFVTHAMRRRLPPLPDLSEDAPSKWSNHPYAIMQLADFGSGHYSPAPPPSHCAECKMDAFIDARRKELPYASPLVPDTHFRGPKPGAPVFVDLHYEGSTDIGVYVSDIISFTATMTQANYMLVRQPLGPIKFTLMIEGVGEIEDILYANCAHRPITRFNLAWVLAYSFRRLAEKTFRRDSRDLALRCLYSADGSKWTAVARFIHRVDC
ncbi:hypothetical protein B0H13DRAFT_1866975 [Mycena leptocephala]|nr:hypothetical protein B0H13DRAFT_1866975 [Mycena leptocephala]